MSTLLIACLFLAVWHWLYESAFAPMARLVLRNRIFSLRDKLRRLAIEQPRARGSEAYKVLEEELNYLANRLGVLRLDAVWNARHELRDQAVRTEIEHKRAIIQRSDYPALREIDDELGKICTAAFVVNTGGWAAYLVPVLIGVMFASEIHRGLRAILFSPRTRPHDDAHGLYA